MGDPLNPVLMGTHGEAGDVMDFAFSDEHVFTSRYASGVDVFTLCQGPIFADGFEIGRHHGVVGCGAVELWKREPSF